MADQEVVLVTGCSSGIGKHLALQFHKHGHRVFASARDTKKLKDLTAVGLETVQLDITSSSSIQAAVEEVIRKAGRIDILVNNAGISSYAPAVEADLKEIRDVFDTNVFGLIELTQLVAKKYMVPARKGKIVQISSIVSCMTTPWNGIYAASKAAVTKYSDALRMELAPFGVKVIIVKPGGVKSEIANNNSGKLESIQSTSIYRSIWSFVQKRAALSQQHAMDTDEFATVVVRRILKTTPPDVILLGTSALKQWLVSRLLPIWASDWILKRMFGLTQLKVPAIGKKAQ